MVDASFSRQRYLEDRVGGVRQRWIFAVAVALILIGLGYVLLQRGLGSNRASVVPSAPAAARDHVSDELLETTKGIQVTQQQAVDEEWKARKGPAAEAYAEEKFSVVGQVSELLSAVMGILEPG